MSWYSEKSINREKEKTHYSQSMIISMLNFLPALSFNVVL